MLKQVMEMYELLDKPNASGFEVKEFLGCTDQIEIQVESVAANGGSTDFIEVIIPGSHGKQTGGDAPTIGLLGRLGGLGARPEVTGFVSDGDGALAALSVASKLITMYKNGDRLRGDVIVTTHICPDAPSIDHHPVRFMGSYVDMDTMNRLEVLDEMDAILSVDTTKGNRIINNNGFAISNTVKEGYILKVSDDLLDVMMRTTGKLPYVFPLSQQDITPYGNGLYHINSILQPNTATKSPVVGVAITTQAVVPGCATGATNLMDVEGAARFMLEVAKDFGQGKCHFYDSEEFDLIKALYGDMSRFQTKGEQGR
ncbi:DUF1177 domain-containing protein [Acidaminobacter sp. JC074]|uniref:DUF1177 domain-containing protein n=1 Tax=Acidaminobacter sp. JC074 TaxID=2530199 RepID=UPI001F10DE2C|nr:DUF1177 domain-containing protein [Acidaminobacter sp. JC074]